MSDKKIVELVNITKEFDGEKVLKGINFSICEGEIVAYIGDNGAGKTTTIDIMLGFLKPDSGDVIYSFNKSKVFSNLSYLPEDNIFPDYLKGEDFLNHFYFFKTEKSLPQEILDFFDNFLEIKPFLKKRIKVYSKGMKRKIGIVNAVYSFNKLIVLDEPFSGLDPSSQLALIELIREVNKKYNCGFFISSHILSNLEQLCHRVIFIKKGKIELNESIETIKAKDISLSDLFRGENK